MACRQPPSLLISILRHTMVLPSVSSGRLEPKGGPIGPLKSEDLVLLEETPALPLLIGINTEPL